MLSNTVVKDNSLNGYNWILSWWKKAVDFYFCKCICGNKCIHANLYASIGALQFNQQHNDLNNYEAKDENAKRKMIWNKHKTCSDWRPKLWIEVRTLSHVWQSRLDSLRGAAHTPRVFRFQRSTRPSDKISPYQRKRLLALQPTVTTLDHSGQLWSAARGVSEVSGRRYDPWQEKRKQKKSKPLLFSTWLWVFNISPKLIPAELHLCLHKIIKKYGFSQQMS